MTSQLLSLILLLPAWTAVDESKKPIAPGIYQSWLLSLQKEWKAPNLRSAERQKLEDKLNQAEEHFIRLKFEDSWQESLSALEQLESDPLISENLERLWKRALALSLLNARQLKLSLDDILRKSAYFSSDPDFQKLIGPELTELLKSSKPSSGDHLSTERLFKLLNKRIGSDNLKIAFYGQTRKAWPDSVSLPLHFVAYDFSSLQIFLGWVESPSSVKIQQTEKFSRYFEASHFQGILAKTRPASLRSHPLWIESPVYSSIRLPGAPTKSPLEQKTEPQSLFEAQKEFPQNDWMETSGFEEEKKSAEWLKSPWFWGIVGAAAIGSGFLIYELSQPDKKTIRTR